MERYTEPEVNALLLAEFMPELLDAIAPSDDAPADQRKITIFAGHDACPMLPVVRDPLAHTFPVE